MAITFGVATAPGTTTATGRSGNGTLTPPLPASWAVGQLAIMLLWNDAGTGSVPTDWTQVSGSPWGSSTPKFQAFWKILETSEPNPTTTISGDAGALAHCAAIMTYNDVDATTPIEAVGAAVTGTGTPMTATAVNTVSDNAWAVGLCGRGDNESASAQSFGGSTTGVTERLDAGSSADDDSQVSAYSKEIATGGSTTGAGSATTNTTDPYVSVIIVLKPAAVPPVTGEAAQAQAPQTQAATGIEAMTAAGAQAQAGQAQAATSTESMIGAVAQAQAPQIQEAAGAESMTGAAAQAQAAQQQAASGTVEEAGVSGSGAQAQAAQTQEAAGAENFLATVAQSQAGQTQAVTAVESMLATVGQTQAAQEQAATGAESMIGTVSQAQAPQEQAATGVVSVPVTGEAAQAQAPQAQAGSAPPVPGQPPGPAFQRTPRPKIGPQYNLPRNILPGSVSSQDQTIAQLTEAIEALKSAGYHSMDREAAWNKINKALEMARKGR